MQYMKWDEYISKDEKNIWRYFLKIEFINQNETLFFNKYVHTKSWIAVVEVKFCIYFYTT